MPEVPPSDALNRLVKFLILLAIAGTLLALAFWILFGPDGNPALIHVPLNAFPTSVNDQITDAVT